MVRKTTPRHRNSSYQCYKNGDNLRGTETLVISATKTGTTSPVRKLYFSDPQLDGGITKKAHPELVLNESDTPDDLSSSGDDAKLPRMAIAMGGTTPKEDWPEGMRKAGFYRSLGSVPQN